MLSPEAIIDFQLDAYNRQDMAAFLSVCHPDVQFFRWPDKLIEQGHDAFAQAYGALWARCPNLKAHILQRSVVGRFVIDLEQLEGHADGPREPLLVIYETQDSEILRIWALDHRS
ncbi:MAG: nuclear transport factor 2 family protein [Limnohabitans sp.]